MAEGFRLCIVYAIRGRLAYLSHLETVEAMRRIVRRAQLPYAVSEGFNPHMKATFGPALPVGASGEGEYFDVILKEYVAPEEALVRLQTAAPANLMPLSCSYTELRGPALDVALPLSSWRAEFDAGDDAAATTQVLQSAFDALLARGYLETVKRKKGKTVVKQVRFDEKIVAAPMFFPWEGHVCMTFVTRQNNEGALRPDLLIDEALKDVEDAPELVALTRTKLAGE